MAEKKKAKDLDPKRKASEVKGGKLLPERERKLVRRVSDRHVKGPLRDIRQ